MREGRLASFAHVNANRVLSDLLDPLLDGVVELSASLEM